MADILIITPRILFIVISSAYIKILPKNIINICIICDTQNNFVISPFFNNFIYKYVKIIYPINANNMYFFSDFLLDTYFFIKKTGAIATIGNNIYNNVIFI